MRCPDSCFLDLKQTDILCFVVRSKKIEIFPNIKCFTDFTDWTTYIIEKYKIYKIMEKYKIKVSHLRNVEEFKKH